MECDLTETKVIMIQLIRVYIFVVMYLSIDVALSGTTYVTDNGIKTMGSSLAYVGICEMEGYMPIGTLGDLMVMYQRELTDDSFKKIRQQYQKSLHDKKQYSIAKDRWISFEIDKKNCASLEKAIPSLKAYILKISG